MKRLLPILLFAVALAAQTPVQLAPAPRLQFFTTNGTPCAGCLLYSYQAGSSTPLATYVDSSGTTPNANPITLDSMGSASVWLANFSYKLVLVDTNGIQIFSVDNIKPSDQTYLRLDFANGPVTGNGTFSGAINLGGGGSFSGTFSGSPSISGNWAFSGSPTFTGAPTFGKITSLTTSPAQSGFLRLAALDQFCIRNQANSGDDCLVQNSHDQWTVPVAIASPSANPAQSGIVALASGDAVSWRNHANTADLPLATDSSDNLTFNGSIIATSSGSSAPLRYSATTPVTVSNTTSASNLQTVTIDSGVLNTVGKTIHMVIPLAATNNSGSSASAALSATIGGQTVTFNSVTVGNGDTCSGTIELDGTVTAAGGSGTMQWAFVWPDNCGSTLLAANSGANAPLTLNTTGTVPIHVLVTLSAASSNFSITEPILNVWVQ